MCNVPNFVTTCLSSARIVSLSVASRFHFKTSVRVSNTKLLLAMLPLVNFQAVEVSTQMDTFGYVSPILS